MSVGPAPVGQPSSASERPLALRVAAVHLRNGALGLARAELEAAAGRGALDEAALLDLAEARWRTGDLGGAGEVANAYLATGRRHPLGQVIAAEAVAALGRPAEARRLAATVIAASGTELDALFAGMPRSLIWPGETPPAADPPAAGPPAPAAPTRPEGIPVGGPLAGRPGDPPVTDGLPPAVDVLEDARRAAAQHDLEGAAVRLAVVLRLDPALAQAVLDAAPPGSSPALDVIRGDAYRVLGRERDAHEAYAAALRAAAVARAEGVDAAPS